VLLVATVAAFIYSRTSWTTYTRAIDSQNKLAVVLFRKGVRGVWVDNGRPVEGIEKVHYLASLIPYTETPNTIPIAKHFCQFTLLGFGAMVERSSWRASDGPTPVVITVREIHLPYWFMLLAFGLIPAVSLIRCVRRRSDSQMLPGHCNTCGYDLRATPAQCPECGTRRTTEAAGA